MESLSRPRVRSPLRRAFGGSCSPLNRDGRSVVPGALLGRDLLRALRKRTAWLHSRRRRRRDFVGRGSRDGFGCRRTAPASHRRKEPDDDQANRDENSHGFLLVARMRIRLKEVLGFLWMFLGLLVGT